MDIGIVKVGFYLLLGITMYVVTANLAERNALWVPGSVIIYMALGEVIGRFF